MQSICQRIRDDHRFEIFIIGVIVAAGVLVGFETSQKLVSQYGAVLHGIDKLILFIFIVEIVIKMAAEGSRPLNYFRNGWNVFDFTIVAVCLLPSTGAWVTVVRLARILRAVRLITQIPRLQVLVGALLKSLPSMGYVSLLLGLHFYVYAVMGTFLFRGNDPGHFGDLGQSMLSLFRVVTLEDWTDVMLGGAWNSRLQCAGSDSGRTRTACLRLVGSPVLRQLRGRRCHGHDKPVCRRDGHEPVGSTGGGAAAQAGHHGNRRTRTGVGTNSRQTGNGTDRTAAADSAAEERMKNKSGGRARRPPVRFHIKASSGKKNTRLASGDLVGWVFPRSRRRER